MNSQSLAPSTLSGTGTSDFALEVRHVSKRFGAVQAISDVSLFLRAGEVTALLGDNGAGKSTLVKCISGMYEIDAGEIFVDNAPVRLTSPGSAKALGIETVHQTLAVVDTINVIENLFLNREITRGGWLGRRIGWLDKRSMSDQCDQALAKLNIRIPSTKREIGLLSGGQRQCVAIGRAVAWGQHIVILDEPAAALGVEQTAKVNELIRTLRDHGVAVLLITHNMHAVTEVCDRAIVLRQGRKAAEVKVADVTIDDLVAYITGARTTGV